VVAIVLEAMAAGEDTKIFGDGRQTRDFVYVDDVVRAVLRSPGKGGVYNVGSGEETSVLELHTRCRAVAGSDREPRMEPPREGDVLRSALDVSLAAAELGWRPETTLDDGLRQTWDWIQARS
jgi:UDP-glucose 4-epimerase